MNKMRMKSQQIANVLKWERNARLFFFQKKQFGNNAKNRFVQRNTVYWIQNFPPFFLKKESDFW